MKIFYTLQGEKIGKGSSANQLITKLARELTNKDISEDMIVRKQGKPFFKGRPIEFSLSHSKELWAIAFSLTPCGLDVQKRVDTRIDAIAGRYFSKEEYDKVKAQGEDAFFRIWTGKEALAKYEGTSIFSTKTSLIEKAEYKRNVNINENNVYIYHKTIGNTYDVTLVTEEENLCMDLIMEAIEL